MADPTPPSPYVNTSLLSTRTRMDNFTPKASCILVTGSSSTFVTFPSGLITGTGSQTFKITNKGTKGAYLSWGVSAKGSVVATASASAPSGGCDYVAAGAILTQDFQSPYGIVDTLAAIQDSATTSLEISIGFGQ